MYNFGNFHLRKFARTVCHSHNVYNPFCVPRKSCYFDNLPLLSNFIKAQRLLTWSLNYGSTYIRHCLKFLSFQGCVIHLLWPWSHFWRMKMKSLWRKNNEKRSLFVFAKQVTFSRTRKVSTNKDTIKKFSKFASLTSIYYRGYYVGPQSFIRICTEVQFLLKFWGQEGNMYA